MTGIKGWRDGHAGAPTTFNWRFFMRFNRTLPSALLAAMILAACGGG
jgi:ABC-type phosphate/phosphonate transport system permease subunit